MFIVPCKFDAAHPYIFECVKNIRDNHPKEKIVVVDSNSEDLSYKDYIEKKYGAETIVAKNINYGTNAFYIAYSKNSCENYYYCLYDSLIVYDNLYDLQKYNVTAIRYFRTPPTGWGYDKDGISLKDWAQEEFVRFQMGPIPEGFFGIMGPMFVASNEVMGRLEMSGIFSIKPTDKYQLCAMERMYGIVLENMGHDFWTHSLQGEMGDFFDNYESSRVKKINAARM
jgi:hypothetical protein